MTTAPRDIATICEAIAAPVIAERGPAPLKARGGRARLLKTESGRIVTHGEVMGALLARAEIEVAVVDGKRPEWIACEVCKVPVAVTNTRGYPPRKCKVCLGNQCSICGNKCNRKGRGPCSACDAKTGSRSEKTRLAMSKKTPEERSLSVKKAHASRSPERRSEIARKHNASMTPEQRSNASRKGHLGRTSEQKNCISEKARNKFSAIERRAISKRNAAAMTPEQRSERVHKAWATRRARKAAEATTT